MNKNGNRAKLSYEECMAILDCIDGLIVTDDSGNIKYMSEEMCIRDRFIHSLK